MGFGVIYSVKALDHAQSLIGRPFQYGQTDCTMICLEMYDIMYNGHEVEKYRGMWTDLKTGLACRKNLGMDIHSWLLGLGAERIPVGFQRFGDFIIAITSAGMALGHVCLGQQSLSSQEEAGVGLCDTVALLNSQDYTVFILRIM